MNDMTPTMVEGELRIKDIDLGERLGFSAPVDIRKLVRRYETDLARMGVIATVAITSGAAGGRPGAEFYLNRKQAIFITAKSETEEATDITIEIIEKFDAYERGAQAPGVITSGTLAAVQAQVNTMNTKLESIQAQIATVISGFDQTQAMIIGYKSMLDIVKENSVVAKGRRSLVQRCSKRMILWCVAQGRAEAMKISRESGRCLFQVDAVAGWLASEGRAIIVAHKNKIAGQGVLTLVPKTRADDPQPAQ